MLKNIRRREEAWLAVLSRQGLRLVEDHAKGELEGFTVKIHPWLDSGNCRIRVWLGETSIETMHAAGAKVGTIARNAAYVGTGDDGLDQHLRVGGRTAAVLALLDAGTRMLLSARGNRGCRIEGSMIIHEHPLDEEENRDLEGTVDRLIELAKCVSCPSDQVLPRLAKNAIGDLLPAVRERCLEAFFDGHRDAPEANDTFALAMLDRSPTNAALGRLGHFAASLPERELLRLRDSDRGAIARCAAKLLEERLASGGTAGRLSLTTASGGELSHTVEGGAISLSPKD